MPAKRTFESVCSEISHLGFSVISPKVDYKNNKSKLRLRCDIGHEWNQSFNNVSSHGSGCPECRKTKMKLIMSTGQVFLEAELLLLGFILHSWNDCYGGTKSTANLECKNGHLFKARPNSIKNGRGCPACAKGTFDRAKDASLYILASECGRFMKIGIAGNVKRRMVELKNATPFMFSIVADIRSSGESVFLSEKILHSKFKSANLSGFDGYTEWFMFDGSAIQMAVTLVRNGGVMYD